MDMISNKTPRNIIQVELEKMLYLECQILVKHILFDNARNKLQLRVYACV